LQQSSSLTKDMSPRKAAILANYERIAPQRQAFRRKGAFYFEEDLRYLRFLIPEGLRILELGCGDGNFLAALKPRYGLGIDFSPTMIALAKQRHPDIEFKVGDVEDASFVASLPGPFDVILIADTIGSLDDCQATLESLHQHCTRETRLVIVYYSHLWEPLLKLAERIGLRAPQLNENILSPADIRALGDLADFESVTAETRLLSPLRLFGIGRLLNRFISMLPVIRHLSLRHYSVYRSMRRARANPAKSATVLIPVRNERGNIERAVEGIPQFCQDIEIVFVEGQSKDGTYEEIERVIAKHPNRDIKLFRQPGRGKSDAVFAGFDRARGDVLMILDGDLTVPPDQLPKFWQAIVDGKGEFINGSRLVYPMEDNAMQFLNLIANRLFSIAFTWLLNQRFTDTLCGTKVLRRSDYMRLKAGRSYFGDFDPFGDFDLIFGATKLNLRCVEVPIRYARRTYGQTQISRFRHGLMLIRMVFFAFFRIKAL
jgi:SAM-dependent methyltransferase